MKLQRISDFVQSMPAYRAGRVRDHRDAIQQYASNVHKHTIVIEWDRPRGAPLAAEVNHGRWVVSCPYCAGASMAEEGEVFFCPDCLMLQNGGFPRPVMFPPNAAEIEAILLDRPDEARRNWLPYETVEALRRENEHFAGGSK